MKYLKIALLVGILCLTGHFFYGDLVFSQTPPVSVQLQTEPALTDIRPLSQKPVHFRLQALDQSGKSLDSAKIHLRLLTPSPTPWFSTDFPWVEGTSLLEMTQATTRGKLEFEQILPIRGQYQLQLQVEPLTDSSFKPFEQNISLAIAEKEIRYRNYLLLLVLLVAIGFVGGWVIGAGDMTERGEIAPSKVRLLLSSTAIIAIAVLLFINITAEVGSSHNAEHHLPKSLSSPTLPTSEKTATLTAQLTGNSLATVGQLSPFTVQVNNPKTQSAIAHQPLSIQTKLLEEERIVFATQTETDVEGKFTWQEQFFDGSPHQVMVTLLSPTSGAEKPLQLQKSVEVEALTPPLFRRLIGLGYMVCVLGLGFLLGFVSHRFGDRTDYSR